MQGRIGRTQLFDHFPLGKIFNCGFRFCQLSRLAHPQKKRLSFPARRDWVIDFSPAFFTALTDDHWTIGNILKVAEEAAPSVIPRVTEHLHFIEAKTFIFYPWFVRALIRFAACFAAIDLPTDEYPAK